jgi:Carboxypeptidase regulatory-like domain/TonB-dependent Receptor Plug Domain
MIRQSVGWTLFLCSVAPAVFAQTAGSLRGTVTDQSGAVAPGATVVLTNEATRFARQAVSDARGAYYFGAVGPGDYTLNVQLAGFRVREIQGIHISPNDARGVDVRLDIGQQTASIEVTAARDTISTETGAREGLLTPEDIDSLSVIGRNPMELMRILPGTVTPNQNSMEVVGKTSGASATSSTTVNGVRGANMMVSLDGAKLQDVGSNNGTLIVLNNEMVSEVKIQTSNYAAEFGSAAVNVQAVTKGGGSKFHAGIYNSLRDHRLSSNEQINARVGGPKPKSSFQFPGLFVSGPILVPGTGFNRQRDKLFFFAAAEVNRQTVDQGTAFSIVPTVGQRQGLFGDYQGGQNLNQSPVVLIPSGFPGAGTPATNKDLRPYMTPDGAKFLSLWPAPNYVDSVNRYNYIFDELASLDRDQELVRIDYTVSHATRAYVRFARDYDSGTRSRGVYSNTSAAALPTPVRATSLGWSVSANATSILSAAMTNEAVFSWSRLKNDNRWDDPAKMKLATYGIDDFQNPFGASPYVPQLQMLNGGGSLYSTGDVDNVFAYSSFVTVADNLARLVKAHAIKVGVSLERWQKRQNVTNAANVRLTFDANAPGGTGVNFGDVLVGRLPLATSSVGASKPMPRTRGGSVGASPWSAACGSRAGRATKRRTASVPYFSPRAMTPMRAYFWTP